jgi:hypothetical protein
VSPTTVQVSLECSLMMSGGEDCMDRGALMRLLFEATGEGANATPRTLAR